MVCPRGEREHYAPSKPIHIPRTRACVAWAERSEAHKGAGMRLLRGERSEPRKGGKAWEEGSPRRRKARRGERDQRKHEPRWDER